MDWPMSRYVERQAQRMHEMMLRQDVDAGKLARLRCGDGYAEARTNCLECRSARECLLWLDARPPSREGPEFCPNLDLFRKCRADEPTQ